MENKHEFQDLRITDPSNSTRWKGTNGESVFINLITDPSTQWFTQGNSSNIMSANISQSVFGDYTTLGLSEKNVETISSTMASLERYAREAAQSCQKPFNVSVLSTEEEEIITYEDIPKIVKVGFFKKETRYERVEHKSKKSVTKTIYFKGWILEHFYKKSKSQNRGEYMNWDYCLGADGNFYLLNSYGDLKFEQDGTEAYDNCCYQIYKCIPLSPFLISQKNYDLQVALNCSFTGTLDYIALGALSEQELSINGELYKWNYPVSTDLIEKKYIFPFGDGLKIRINELLSLQESIKHKS